MRGWFRVAALCAASFAAGVIAQRLYDRGIAAGEASDSTVVPHGDVATAVVDFTQQPLWAYGFLTPPAPGEKAEPQRPPSRALRPNEDETEQTRLRSLPGSAASFSLVDIRDGSNVIDWYPEDHPKMTDIIRLGPSKIETGRRGCGFCHLPNGLGRPENAPTAGLPPTYFVQQLKDFKNGLRRSADPRKPNTNTMIDLARAMTDEEMVQAAQYFAAITWRPRVKVIETALVPKTRIVGNLFLPTETERTEPIAGRIIEVPEDEERAERLRDPRSGFVAYVPPGSLARGKQLVRLGGAEIVGNQIVQGKTTACTACHAPDLMGVGDVPPIAGRSPSYLARQIFDIQQGARRGAAVDLMKVAVAKLNADDITAIASYVASKFPPDPQDIEAADEIRADRAASTISRR
jgi:cytochrome c553